MRRCPHCNDWVALRAVRCIWCSQPLAPETARPKPDSVTCSEWMDELAKRIARRRDEKDDYPETEHGKAAGLDEALELLATLRSEIEGSSIEKLTD